MAQKPKSFTPKQMSVIVAASKSKTLLPKERKAAKAFVRMLKQSHIGDDLATQVKKNPEMGKSCRYHHLRSIGRLVLVETIKNRNLAQKVLDYNETSSGKPRRKK